MTHSDPWQGPEEADAWEKVVPGSAEQLFTEYRLQLSHRRRVELASVRLTFFGPILGLIVVLSFLGTAAWLISEGYGIEGTFLGTVDIASLAAVFVLGLQSKPRPGGQLKESERAGDIQLQPDLSAEVTGGPSLAQN